MTQGQTGQRHFQVAVVGGGSAGIAVAARLLKKRPHLSVGIIEPSEHHYYQPGWTLVGGGIFSANETRREQRRCIPVGAQWLRERAVGFEPENNRLRLAGGGWVGYDMLVVCPGLQLDWHRIDGLEEALGTGGVTSNYRFDLAPYTWECIQTYRGGPAVFTQPAMPIKCAGAPQKILYLAADYWRQAGIEADLRFSLQGGAMFGIPLFAEALEKVAQGYGAAIDYGHDLVAVDPGRKVASFARADGERVERPYELLHVVPPQSAPEFIKASPLADANGWVDVDRHTLQHTRFANIFALGDVAGTPNSKTAAAVRQQAPIVVENLLEAMAGKPLRARYDGYGACPLTTARGRVMLAEFAYDGVVTPSFPGDPTRERRSYWYLKKIGFPVLYWDVMLQGYFMAWPHHKPRQAAAVANAA